MYRSLSVCAGLLLLGSGNFAWADDARIGRLADGRAYRVDSEGNELVDQLAELELQGQEANFRIQALEEDLQQKDKIIQKLSRTQSEQPKFFENVKTTRPNDCETMKRELRVARTAFENSRVQLEQVNAQLAEAQIREAELKQQQQIIRTDCNKAAEAQQILKETSLANEKCQAENQQSVSLQRQLRGEIDYLKGELRQALDAAQQSDDLRKQFSYDKLAWQRQLSEKEQELAQMRRRLSATETTLAETKRLLLATKTSFSELAKQQARQETVSAKRVDALRARYQPSVTKRNVVKHDAVFDSYRLKATELIQELDALKVEREKLYAAYSKKQNRAVSFKLGALRTNTGSNYSSIRNGVSRASSARELASSIGQLEAIEKLLNDDIALLKRLG